MAARVETRAKSGDFPDTLRRGGAETFRYAPGNRRQPPVARLAAGGDARGRSDRGADTRGKEDDAIVISTLFEAHGQFDSAYTVLTPYLDNIGRSTDLEQQVVDVMLEQRRALALLHVDGARGAKAG